MKVPLKSRFTWVSDGRLDSWHILPVTGAVEGDCDDYAVTVLAELVDRSALRFMWWLVTFRAVFWVVTSPRGSPHLALWVRGLGWTDNWKDKWTPTADPHTKRYPMPWPMALLKLIIGIFDRT